MARLLLFLPLCAFACPSYPCEPGVPREDQAQPVDRASFRPQLVGILAAVPPAPFPATVPWASLGLSAATAAPTTVPLPDPDPVAFLEKCLARYDREVQGYTCILWKQERIDGRVNPPEKVQAAFKERPYSVFMRWLLGARKAQCALYVEGQNHNNLLALGTGLKALVGPVQRSPTGTEARESGRYPITEFGIRMGMARTLKSWQEARAENALHIAYLGLYRVPETGDRVCYKLHRTRYARPEEDGVTDLTVYIDRENWLQVGSVLRGQGGQLIAEYFFQDIHLNPQFAPRQFDRSALRP